MRFITNAVNDEGHDSWDNMQKEKRVEEEQGCAQFVVRTPGRERKDPCSFVRAETSFSKSGIMVSIFGTESFVKQRIALTKLPLPKMETMIKQIATRTSFRP